MKTFITFIVAFVLYAGAPSVAFAQSADKDIVKDAFAAWQTGNGSPFGLLADDATWTILGPIASAGTYTKPDLETQILQPFNARLATPLVPRVIDIYQAHDTIIILFDAQATLITGDLYSNSYAWFFKMKDGVVQAVTAVLDTSAFEKVMNLPLK